MAECFGFEYVENPRQEVFNLVEQYHYSRLVPAAIKRVDGLMKDGKIVAGIIWTTPASRWPEPTIELARLVRNNEPAPLSFLISQSCKKLRIMGEDLCLSFADTTHKHHGGIYQASSWNFHGSRKGRIDAFLIDGIRVPCRTCNHRYGTSGIGLVGMLEKQGIECIPQRSQDKNLYWRALNKDGQKKAERLGLLKSKYPKGMVK